MGSKHGDTILRTRRRRCALRAAGGALALLALTQTVAAASIAQASFASPEEAVAALADAVKVNDRPILSVILGPRGSALINSGDAVQDQRERDAFISAYGEAHELAAGGGNKTGPRSAKTHGNCRFRW